MAAQVEVKLGRVCDGAVDRGACWDIPTLPNLQEYPEIKKIILLEDRPGTGFTLWKDPRTRSALSEQKRRVWWRFWTTM